MKRWLENYFQLQEHGTSVRTEVIAGITTFLTAAYIIFINPAILSKAGMDHGAVFTATCLMAAIGSLVMGLYANYPVAVAPAMGTNAYFTYTVVIKMGYSWQAALMAVFVSGALFFILTITKAREKIIQAIPMSLKIAMGAGIGLFLGVIALENAGIVVNDQHTLVTLGQISYAPALLCLLGFCLIVALDYHRIPGAIIWGILIISFVGMLLGVTSFEGIASLPPSIKPTFLQLDFSHIFETAMLITIGTFLFVIFFDSTTTLIVCASRLKLVNEAGHVKGLSRALQSDSAIAALGGLLGTSSCGAYIESTAGIRSGGRTGLVAVVIGLLFLAALFLSPLAKSIPSYATSAGLLFVACIMCEAIKHIAWSDVTESAPAVITTITMPLTYSITNGVSMGFISYTIIKILSGQIRQLSLITIFISVISLIYLLSI